MKLKKPMNKSITTEIIFKSWHPVSNMSGFYYVFIKDIFLDYVVIDTGHIINNECFLKEEWAQLQKVKQLFNCLESFDTRTENNIKNDKYKKLCYSNGLLVFSPTEEFCFFEDDDQVINIEQATSCNNNIPFGLRVKKNKLTFGPLGTYLMQTNKL